MGRFFKIALRNLLHHRTRSLILAGSISLVTALFVILLAVTNGIQKTMIDNGTVLSSGFVNIGGFYKLSQSSAAPLVTEYSKLEKLAREVVPEATTIIHRVKAWGTIISDTNSIQLPIWGADPTIESQILGTLPLADRADYLDDAIPNQGLVGDINGLAESGSLVIFAAHAKKLAVQVGDLVTISMPTYRNINNTMDVKVVAILKDQGMMSNWTVFMNADDVRTMYQIGEDTTGAVMIYLPSIEQVADVEERLRAALIAKDYLLMDKDPQPFWMKFDRVAGESWTGQKIDVTTWEDETSFVKWIVTLFNALTYALTSVLMVIVILGLVNTLWMAIKERTAEIGTLRAIGLQRRQVLTMFFLESLILSVSSMFLGLAIGVLTTIVVNGLNIEISSAFQMFLMSDTLRLAISFDGLLSAALTILLFILVGAVIPAYRASKLKPITAINYVE